MVCDQMHKQRLAGASLYLGCLQSWMLLYTSRNGGDERSLCGKPILNGVD